MSEERPRLSILVLTEDSGEDADLALRHLLARLLGKLAPGAAIAPERWEPATAEARAAMQANAWKSRRRQDLVRFRQYIAAKLRERGGFVFFHFDGDRRYSERGASENAAKFEAMIRAPVRQILEGPPRRRDARRSVATSASAAEIGASLEKLIAVVPYYSIEAWTFQNTAVAAERCRADHGCRRGCAAKLRAWTADRRALDEVLKPKADLCLGSAHNAELLQTSYPLAEVLAAGTSLADLFAAMQRSEALLAALRPLRPPWSVA